jgi:phosphate starvation-inducible PhoH-like protein
MSKEKRNKRIELASEQENLGLSPDKVSINIQGNDPVLPKNEKQERFIAKGQGGAGLLAGIGPAGTGKTYLAVLLALEKLLSGEKKRIVISRRAVEAGESLGFLPGDLAQKVDPYLRPIYDVLYEFLGPVKTQEMIEQNVIEVAPLAYMRGRTFNDAVMVLDEGQNTTKSQMKMFLTRAGYGTDIIICADPTQSDIPEEDRTGLPYLYERLNDEDLSDIVYHEHFDAKGVVRSELVSRLIRSDERHQAK